MTDVTLDFKAQKMKCERCGRWARAHATLPGQPVDHLCMCERTRSCGTCRLADSWGIPLDKTCQYTCQPAVSGGSRYVPMNGPNVELTGP